MSLQIRDEAWMESSDEEKLQYVIKRNHRLNDGWIRATNTNLILGLVVVLQLIGFIALAVMVLK